MAIAIQDRTLNLQIVRVVPTALVDNGAREHHNWQSCHQNSMHLPSMIRIGVAATDGCYGHPSQYEWLNIRSGRYDLCSATHAGKRHKQNTCGCPPGHFGQWQTKTLNPWQPYRYLFVHFPSMCRNGQVMTADWCGQRAYVPAQIERQGNVTGCLVCIVHKWLYGTLTYL